MKALKKKTWVVIFSVFAVNITTAQFYKDMSLGLQAGGYIYQGDLTPERLGAFKTPGVGLSVYATKPINRFLSARLNFSIAKLKADENRYTKPEWRQQRNFAFTTPVKEFSALVVLNIQGTNYDDPDFTPYVFAGAGMSFLKVNTDYSKVNTDIFAEGSQVQNGLAADIIHGVPKKIAVLPIGIGFQKSISDRISINLETTYRFLFTDYLDGFSQAANPKKNDNYHSTAVGVVYKFGINGKGIGCPVMRY